ncbi:MAG: DUF4832 domain-containing protein, partial [Anaerolineae bacterium]|nr:DUF4832 domain-containing protein [Anaerolineae bacterium]
WLALLAALCLLWAWRDAGRRRGALVALLLAVGIAAPVYLAMLTTPAPDGGLGRTLVTDAAELQRNVQNWLQAWRGYGDINPNHNIPNWPILDEVQAGLALAGLVAGWLVLRRRWEGLLLLALFLLALLPGLITLRTPQYIRAYGIIVPLALVIGAGARLLAGSPHARGARLRGALAAGLLLVSLGHSATVWHAWLREYRLVLYIDDRINTGMALIQAQTAPGTPIYFPYSGAAPATTIPFHPVADFHARAMQRPLVFFAFPDQPGVCFVTPRGPVVYLDLPNLVNQMARRAAAYGEVQRLGATPPDEVNVLLFTPAAALVDDWPGAARSDDALLLHTVSAPALTAAPGDTIAMDLGLRVLRPPARPLTFFVHLQGDPTPYEGGPLYAGGDAPLCAAALEPGRRPEETLVQRLTLTLPADLPPGAYHVAVGLYDPASGQRPPLVTATGDRRFYRAADITVR